MGAGMDRLDLKRELRHLYAPTADAVVEVDVPRLRCLMIDGQGDPDTSPAYAEAVEALFSVSYTAKFMLKRGEAIDYAVMPLEGLWWADDPAVFLDNDRARWQWTMLVVQPDIVDEHVLEDAIDHVRAKKRLAAVDRLRLEDFTEGRCAQTLHVGPFREEGPTIARVHAYIAGRSRLAGKHHEIYLSDVRRTDPARWRTIIRQPMA